MSDSRRRLAAVAAAAVGSFAVATCVTPLDGTQVAGGGVAGGGSTGHGCGRRCLPSGGATGGGSSGGSSAGGGSTGAPTSTGGGDAGPQCEFSDAGGSSPLIPFDCTDISPFFHGDAGPCTGSPYWFGTVITDYQSCGPVCGAQIQLVDQNGVLIPGASTISKDDGTAYICLRGALTYSPYATANNSGSFYYGEIQGQLLVDIPTLGMLTTTEIDAFEAVVGGIDSSKGQALFFVFGLDPTCGDPSKASNWTVSLDMLDGGAYPDGSYTVIYPSATGFPTGASSTSSLGVALVANIDLSYGSFVRPVYNMPANAAGCALMNDTVGFTGRVYVAQQSFAEQGIFLQATPDGGP